MPRRRLLLVAGAASIAPGLQAQAWPAKPIKIIVPFPPGQSTDVLARIMADRLTKALGQQVIAENKPGAAGSIGADVAAKAGADLNYGSSGNGSASHLAVELLKSKAGIRLTHVPFKGNADALLALQSGDIQLLSDAMPGAVGP